MNDLRSIIIKTLDECDSPDPHDVAALVAERIPAGKLRSIVRELLPDAVREVIRQHRGTVPAPPVNGKRGVGEMARDPWRMQRFVPGQGWKRVGTLTADDCEAIAAEYRRQADFFETHGKRWALLAEEMRRRNVLMLRDLGADAIRQAQGVGAVSA